MNSHKSSIKILLILTITFLVPQLIMAQGSNPPAPVVLKYVTVDRHTDYVHIFWNKTASINVDGYYIWGKDTTTDNDYLVIDTVLPTELQFVDSFAHPDYQAECYNVTPFNEHGLSDFAEREHHTIHLQYSFRKCYGQVILSWTPYVGWDAVYRYRVMVEVDGSLPFELATLEGNADSYKDLSILADLDYTYWIEATSLSGEYISSSNHVKVYTNMPHPPSFINADYASVIEEDNIELGFTVEENLDTKAYDLLRSSSPNYDFEVIKTFDTSEVFFNQFTYIDHINTDEVWYYKIAAVNICPGTIYFPEHSNIASNMMLDGNTLRNMANELEWFHYFQWKGEIDYFSIYRLVGEDTFLIGQTPYGDTTIQDDLEAFVEDFSNSPYYHIINPDEVETPESSAYPVQPVLSGKFCYFVEAHEKNNPYGIMGVSKSNDICLISEPVFWMPNAFAPASNITKNRYFQPFLSFGGFEDYNLQIFNKLGSLIFESNELKIGWDGKIQNENAPMGVYPYIIRYSNGNGEVKEITGGVTLVR